MSFGTSGNAATSRTAGGRALGAAIVVAMILGACTSSTTEKGTDATGTAGPKQLKVMEFNIEYGGEEIEFDGVIAAIEAAGAEVVGIEEAYGNMPRIADELGWDYYDARMQIVSQYPLLAPSGSDGLYTYVALEPGRVVAIGNVHLPSSSYGPFKVRDGAKPAEALATEEKVRMPAIEPSLEALAGLPEEMPVFLLGDFNAPSHLDWTEEAVGSRDHVKFALDWPVGEAVEQAGFHDSWRDVYPDPVQDPGLTWPAARPRIKHGYNPGLKDRPADRIDMVYAAGPATTVASEIVGEEEAEEVDIPVAPWPSDHRAVVSTFEVTPATPPTFVAVDQRLVAAGEDVRVTFHSDGEDGERVVIVAGGGEASAALAEQPTGEGSPADGTLEFSTEGWDPGAYEAVLVGASGGELDRIPFWLGDPDGKPEVSTTKSSYKVDEPIEVEWHGSAGNRWDWVGIYKRGADPNVAWYILWLYTESAVDGSLTFDRDAHGPWPLKAGKYTVYLLEDDSYESLAGGNFTISG